MVSGWLVLKSFSSIDSEKRNAKAFYAYLLGNVMSLAWGSATGFIMKFYILRYAYGAN